MNVLALLSQTIGAALGALQQSPLGQFAERSVDAVEALKMQAREAGGVKGALGVRRVDDLVLEAA